MICIHCPNSFLTVVIYCHPLTWKSIALQWLFVTLKLTWKLGCYLHQGYTKIIMIQSKSSVAINYINSDSGQITILV